MASQKSYEIIVNGRKHEVGAEITFEEVVKLAYGATTSNQTFTVTYRRGQGNKPQSSLRDGESTKVKEGMIFNVTATTKS